MKKRVPLRKCILTQEMHPKKDLLRIVVNKENEVFADATGKKNGRGSYVVKDLEKVKNAREGKVLESRLGFATEKLDPVYDEIIRLIYREDIPKR
ncbi:RNase P modulator RnpM [Salinicoccus carnicancri]|uniref:RNase P modulator RnpM n=1 Tax=Salinicoccus carnicancri TaxID=558170 RepID=UPI0002DE85DA|nr:YlxR family protein [Salinicoccus carnicancri]